MYLRRPNRAVGELHTRPALSLAPPAGAVRPAQLLESPDSRAHGNGGGVADGRLHASAAGRPSTFSGARGAFAVGLATELLWTQQLPQSPYGWFGTVIDEKEDGTGTLYRRNRSVDPATGRLRTPTPPCSSVIGSATSMRTTP